MDARGQFLHAKQDVLKDGRIAALMSKIGNAMGSNAIDRNTDQVSNQSGGRMTFR
jgi:hypothetical protein